MVMRVLGSAAVKVAWALVASAAVAGCGRGAETDETRQASAEAVPARRSPPCGPRDLRGVTVAEWLLGAGCAEAAPRPTRPTPSPSPGASSGAATSVATSHSTYAVLGDGTVRAFGWNRRGELGDGTTTDQHTPVAVRGLADVTQVSGGHLRGTTSATVGQHACALTRAGEVWCWGFNSDGQLGDGTTTDRAVAQRVPGLRGVVQVAVGARFTCALLGDGALRCWGDNEFRQLGDGTSTDHATPTAVPAPFGPVAEVATGAAHTCVRTRAGEVWCWGANTWEQLCAEGVASPSNAVRAAFAGATALRAGANFTCALGADGQVQCCGANLDGQLGDGDDASSRWRPAPVRDLANATGLSAGGAHACAVERGGAVHCWGRNLQAQLGDGTVTNRPTPVRVAGLGAATEVAAGGAHTCARLPDGSLRCWGANQYGELGDGTTTRRERPVAPRL